MIIYLDIVIFLNLLVNLVLLLLIDLLFHDHVYLLKTIISALIGSSFVISFLFNYIIFLILKVAGGIIIAFLAYYHNNRKKIVIKAALFYLLNLAIVGVLTTFKITNFYLLILALIFVLIIILLETQIHIFTFKHRFKYCVVIEFSDYIITGIGYLDTGNFAVDENACPIIFVDEKHFSEKLIPQKEIIINTINNGATMMTYRPLQIKIYQQRMTVTKECLVVFAKLQQSFDCLLNAYLFL